MRCAFRFAGRLSDPWFNHIGRWRYWNFTKHRSGEKHHRNSSPNPDRRGPQKQLETIESARPNATDGYAFNSGGPEENEQADGENTEIENQIRLIAAKADPDFMPSIWPHMGKINNEFGFRRNPFGGRTYEFHPGMDIDGERGELVVAPANGTVIKAGWTGGYGNMVEIDHGNGLTTRYGHMSKIDRLGRRRYAAAT